MKKLIILVLVILALAACVNMQMVWNESTPYGAGAQVLVKVNGIYETYISLQDRNQGNYPPDTLKVWWDQ